MRRKILLSVLFLFVIISFASASIPTTIVINTAPNHSLMIRMYNPGTVEVLESMYKNSDEMGKLIISFDSPADEYDLEMWLKNPSTNTYDSDYAHERFEETFTAGEGAELNLYPEWYHLDEFENLTKTNTAEVYANATAGVETNETIQNNSTNETIEIPETIASTENKNNKTKEKVTALSISDGKVSISGNILYYVGGIIVLAVLIIIFLRWNRKRNQYPREPKPVKVVKLSEITQQVRKDDNEIKSQEDKIEAAKKMIRDAEEQIKRARNPNYDRIEAAKRKLIEDERELMRLRREARS